MARFKNLRRRNYYMQFEGRDGPVRIVARTEPIATPPRRPSIINRKNLPPNFPIRKDFASIP